MLSALPNVEELCPIEAVEIAGPKLFRVLDDFCYLFMTYDDEIYMNTQLKCQQHGGNLAMPKTKKENDFLLQGMKELKQSEPMWIGLQYKALEGALVWEDGEKAQWDNFDAQTRANLSDGGNCVVIQPDDVKWRAHPCEDGVWYSSRMPFICQYPIPEEDVEDADITIDDMCPPFFCPDLDCGMIGFKLENGCQICECNM